MRTMWAGDTVVWKKKTEDQRRYLDVVKEDMQEMKRLTEVYGESADGAAGRRSFEGFIESECLANALGGDCHSEFTHA